MHSDNIPKDPFSSLTYHSQISETFNVSEPCILGVDEAGRGPAIGPMVYACAYCPMSYRDNLAKAGYNDSKVLNAATRENLLEKIEADELVGWSVRVMSAQEISSAMLRPKVSVYNLNHQAHDTTMMLIDEIVTKKKVNVKEVYVDTVGPPETYQAKLSRRFPGIKFTVAKKADSLFPIVSAASICAKVTRDACLKYHDESAGTWGSGYPSDPNTTSWLNSTLDPFWGFSSQVRFSWGTIRQLMLNHVDIKWADDLEEASRKKATNVSKYFKSDIEKESTPEPELLKLTTAWYGAPGGKNEHWF